MKTKSKLLTGAVAGLSFLALAATGAFASVANTGDAHCSKGTVIAVGSGYTYPAFGTLPSLTVAGQRTVKLRCDAGFDSGDADNTLLGSISPAMSTTTERTFLIPATPDKDGIYAAALTALADSKDVRFVLYSTPGYATTPATTLSARHTATYYHRGYIKLLEVLNTP